jgi:hypothetical protein
MLSLHLIARRHVIHAMAFWNNTYLSPFEEDLMINYWWAQYEYVLHSWLPVYDIFTCISDFRCGFGLANRFIGYSPVVTKINYNTFKTTVIITYK